MILPHLAYWISSISADYRWDRQTCEIQPRSFTLIRLKRAKDITNKGNYYYRFILTSAAWTTIAESTGIFFIIVSRYFFFPSVFHNFLQYKLTLQDHTRPEQWFNSLLHLSSCKIPGRWKSLIRLVKQWVSKRSLRYRSLDWCSVNRSCLRLLNEVSRAETSRFELEWS